MKIWTLIGLLALASACAANPARFAEGEESSTEALEEEAEVEETPEAETAENTTATSADEVQSEPPTANVPGQQKHHHGDNHAFKNPEKRAERWNSPERDAWQKPTEVLGFMSVQSGMSVADIGTGTGYFIPHLSKAVGPTGQVWGLDVSQEMVDYVARTSRDKGLENVIAKKVFAGGPGFDAQSIDRYLIVNTWHHIAQREIYAQRLYDSLKPGGKVVIVEYTTTYPDGPPKEMRLAPLVVESELSAGGFDVELVQETLPRQYIVVGHKR